jgi:hypothetical protein
MENLLMNAKMIRPMIGVCVVLVSAPLLGAIASTPPDVPHIDPLRVLPTEEHSPTATPTMTPTYNEGWFERCVGAGTCGDFGRQCPAIDPGEGVDADGNYSLRTALWCSRATWPRGDCKWSFLPGSCTSITSDGYCGRELRGTCDYSSNGTLIGIDPDSVMPTGNWCAGSSCS